MLILSILLTVIYIISLVLSPILIITILEFLSVKLFNKYLDDYGEFTPFKAVILVILVATYYIFMYVKTVEWFEHPLKNLL